MQDHTRSSRCAQFKQPPGGLDDRVAATAAFFFLISFELFLCESFGNVVLNVSNKTSIVIELEFEWEKRDRRLALVSFSPYAQEKESHIPKPWRAWVLN